MNRIVLSSALGALALGGLAAGAAYAQQAGQAPWRGDITRAGMQARAEAMFARLDANHDGKLDAADRAARLGQRFDALDTDHDGKLSRAEFTAMHAHPPADGAARVRGGGGMAWGYGRALGMTRGAPANGGAITRADFVAGALRRFDALDTDKNGVLSAAERGAGRAAWRAAHDAPASPGA